MTNIWFVQYNEILSQENHNQLHILTEFGSTALHHTRLRYAKRKYRRFWNCFELSATDKRNRQFRLWISKPVTWMWNQHHKGISLSFCRWVGTHLCAGFFAAQMPVTTEWPAEWDMILRQPLFSESERNNAAWDGGRDRKTTFRQTGGKQQTVCGRKSVAYRSKQGNCIDSFRPNRL